MSVKAPKTRRKVVRAKPARQHATSAARQARPAKKPTANGRVRRVDAALKRYEKACRVASARGEDLASLANVISEASVAKYSASIVRDWCEKQFLRDVIGLRDALAEHPPGSLEPRLEQLRLLPAALLQWLEMRFRVVPTGSVAEELEIPVARLRNYSCDFDVPEDNTRLLKVHVIAVGWKCGNTVIIPPRVRLAV